MNYHCAKFYANISINVDTKNNFPYLAIFSQKFYYFTSKVALFEPFHLGIIANIVS